jgi:hypothetical protein
VRGQEIDQTVSYNDFVPVGDERVGSFFEFITISPDE